MNLIPEGYLGFVMHSGVPEILSPGRYFFSSCFSLFQKTVSQGDMVIECGPISIIRIPQGSVGLAYNNSDPELLLPGRHVRTKSSFKYQSTQSLGSELI